MPEPLILKIQADTQGVPEGLGKVQRGVDGLDISSRKASSAIKGFVQDISQAKDASDVASAALGAFSKILGTSIGATAIVIAGKAVIDTFSNISKTVNDTRDNIERASKEIKNAGTEIGLAQAAGEAKKLSDEANKARENIEKLDKSFLGGLVATILGAREELEGLAKRADELAQQRLFEGARGERIRAQQRAGLVGGALEIKDVEERVRKELSAVKDVFGEGAKTANEILLKGQIDIDAIRKKSFDEFDKKQAALELKGIEADISGAKAAADIAAKSDAQAAEQARKNLAELNQKRQELEERLNKEQKRLNKDGYELRIKAIDLEQRLIDARKNLIEAEGKVAGIVAGFGGSMRGAGERRTSFEIGMQASSERAFQEELRRLTILERERIKMQLRFERGLRPSDFVSGFDVQQRITEMARGAARQRAGEPFSAAAAARAQLGATEDTLSAVKENLEKVLNELKTYAHTT